MKKLIFLLAFGFVCAFGYADTSFDDDVGDKVKIEQTIQADSVINMNVFSLSFESSDELAKQVLVTDRTIYKENTIVSTSENYLIPESPDIKIRQKIDNNYKCSFIKNSHNTSSAGGLPRMC